MICCVLDNKMIKTFNDNIAQQIYNGFVVKKLDKNIQKLALRKLRYLDAAVIIEDLKIPPGNSLEKLKGNLSEYYSIRINDQYRFIFKWIENNVYDVKLIDYH